MANGAVAPCALVAALSLAGCVQVGPSNLGPALIDETAVAVRALAGPHAKSVVVIVMENRDYGSIVGNAQAPYINKILLPQAALMTNSHAVTHPSQPNYLALFSGSTQGIRDDSCPHSFGASNAGAEMLAAGETFAGYSESMPYDGYTGCWSGKYARKHNPWVDFTNVPASSNLVYTALPKSPPKLTIIMPNLCDDMHDCSTQTGDAWLSKNVPPILKYDRSHHGLFILTWDEAEPDSGTNQIATLLIGPMVAAGSYGQLINHYSVLRTIEDVAGIACTANACQAEPIKKIWR